jgi:hypothetical protein
MKSWLGPIRRWQRWFSWPALGALGVAIFTAGFHVSVVRPAQLELDALQREVASLRVQYRLTGPAAQQNPRVQLVRFYESFPSGASAPNWLERIYAAAQSNHLELMEGDYRILRKGHEQLAQYQITLPLKGSYPNIRGFLNAMLSELPSVSLDNVAFERQKIGEASVQVTVRLTLYLREGQ